MSSQPGLEPRASGIPTELLRPDILIDSHTPGYPDILPLFEKILPGIFY